MTTLRPGFQAGGRGTASDSFELPGLWADLDLAGPGHTAPPAGLALLPDLQAARDLVDHLPEPTLWVHSGGGLYPWWLLHQPHPIEGDLAELSDLSRRWHQSLTDRARRRGLHVPGTGDLARVLRLPGTWNRKAGLERPCRILEESGTRYFLAELQAALGRRRRRERRQGRLNAVPLLRRNFYFTPPENDQKR